MSECLRLDGRTALITGSTSNIGRSIAIRLAEEGARVVVSGRDAERGATVIAGIRHQGGAADFVAADLDGRPETSRELARQALKLLGGRVDILINNAGIFPNRATTEVDGDTFDRVYAVNVKTPYFLTAALVPQMIERGSGVIINLGSWVARLGLPGGLYASTKGAMETLTRAWATEFGPSGVRVNAVSPGVTYAPEQTHRLAAGSSMMNGTPAGRVGSPDEIAAAVAYLVSDDASFVHGAVLDVDGGRVSAGVVAR